MEPVTEPGYWLHCILKRHADHTVQIEPVRSFQENPYVMLRQNHQDLEGNDRYEGFCVDMLKELADILKFKYRIRLVGDGLYGVPGANGTWTGMVGELISRVGWCTVYSQHCVSYQSQLIYCLIISLSLWTGSHRLCCSIFLRLFTFSGVLVRQMRLRKTAKGRKNL